MKKRSRKLELSKETVQRLTATDEKKAAGGISLEACQHSRGNPFYPRPGFCAATP